MEEKMKKKLPIGIESFEKIRADNFYYIDKTGMIRDLLLNWGEVNLFTRPRRFGKSLNMSMLKNFFEIGCRSEFFDELQHTFPGARKDSSLPEMLFNTVENGSGKFIMIIDEWDALFREAKDDTRLQREYIDLLRSLFKSSWTDIIFEAAYMTGILPIKRYGTQSAVSDFREYTMLSPGRLVQYIGFTEQEVRELCEQYDMDFNEMKYWYDGYSFRRLRSVYSPNSVMEAIKRDEFGSYWTRTETYESLRIYIDLDEDGLRESIIRMIAGEQVRVDVGTFQNDMTNIQKKDDVLTLLIHLGYLAYDSEKETAYIPNEEVRKEFLRAVSSSRHKEA